MHKLVKLGSVVAVTAAMVLGGGAAANAALNPVCRTVPTSTTVTTGTPGTNYWKDVQCFASRQGHYVGPINGIMGYNSWLNLQIGVRDTYGCYPGPLDGTQNSAGWALQCIAVQGGYTGPVNGIPGPNTYKQSSGYLNYLAIEVWHQE